MATAIEARSLRKVYRDTVAVSGLDVEIQHGELFALLGLNGAGKTTTIKMLTCLTRPTSGDAVVAGHSVLDDQAGVKAKVNVSPQETAVARNLTVRENLEMISRIYGVEKASSREEAQEMIDLLGLGAVASVRAKRLSGGMQRRLSIAMALISHPEVLFLDEPTLGLDVLARRELWAAIEALKGRMTIVLTTHYLEEAEALSDRIGVMSNGALCAVGTPEQLVSATNAKSFEDAFISLATSKVA